MSGLAQLRLAQLALASGRGVGGIPPWVPVGAEWFVDLVDSGRAYINGLTYGSASDLLASADASFSRASGGTYRASDNDYAVFSANELRTGDRGGLIEAAATNLNKLHYINGTPYWFRAAFPTVGVGSLFGLTAGTFTSLGDDFRGYAIYDESNAAFIVARTAYTIPSDGRVIKTWTTPSGCVSARTYPFRDITNGKYIYSVQTVAPETDYVSSWLVEKSGLDYRICGVQVETGSVPSSPILTTGSVATRAADALTLFPNAATYDVTVTFDDDSTQVLASQVVGGGGWAVPTDLDRAYIKNIAAVLS